MIYIRWQLITVLTISCGRSIITEDDDNPDDLQLEENYNCR